MAYKFQSGTANPSGSLIPALDDKFDLGSSAAKWKDLYIDGTANADALVAATAKVSDLTDNRIVIAGTAGELEDSASLTYDGSDIVLGDNVDLGGANTDLISVVGRFDTDLDPSTSNARDLGDANLQWKDLYLDGVAYIDTLGADGDPTTAYIGGGEIDGTVIGSETPAAATVTDLVANGNVDLGDATSDTITVTGQFDSDLIPSTDSSRTLGSSAKQWLGLHLDVGYIDQLGAALDANSQAITNINVDSGAIDGTTIGASAQSSVRATTLSASSNMDLDGNMQVNGSIINFPKLLGLTSAGEISGSDFFMALDATTKDVIVTTRNDVAGDMAGAGLEAVTGVFRLDISEFGEVVPANGDSLLTLDSDGSTEQLTTLAALGTLMAGAGMTSTDSVLNVVNATNGGLSVAADDMKIDLNDLVGGGGGDTIDVANDSIAFIDASDSSLSKKESIVDLVAAMVATGGGLSASGGQLSVAGSSAPTEMASGGNANVNLVEGFNFGATTIDAARTYTLPSVASLDTGDVVTVKIGDISGAGSVTIVKQGSDTIDGSGDPIELDSPFGSVSFKVVAAGKYLMF